MTLSLPKTLEHSDFCDNPVIVIDGQNVYYHNTRDLTGQAKKKQQQTNITSLIIFLEHFYKNPVPIIVLPKYKRFMKESWSDSGWICFLADQKQSKDDYWIINYALQTDAIIISNDSYRDWSLNRDKLSDKLVSFEIIGNHFVVDHRLFQNLDEVNLHESSLKNYLEVE